MSARAWVGRCRRRGPHRARPPTGYWVSRCRSIGATAPRSGLTGPARPPDHAGHARTPSRSKRRRWRVLRGVRGCCGKDRSPRSCIPRSRFRSPASRSWRSADHRSLHAPNVSGSMLGSIPGAGPGPEDDQDCQDKRHDTDGPSEPAPTAGLLHEDRGSEPFHYPPRLPGWQWLESPSNDRAGGRQGR